MPPRRVAGLFRVRDTGFQPVRVTGVPPAQPTILQNGKPKPITLHPPSLTPDPAQQDFGTAVSITALATPCDNLEPDVAAEAE
jgi:hypothetical protein